MRRLKLRNLTICLCMICVVTFSVATPIMRVSALAQPVIDPELAPVFDTKVYEFTDYIEENLSDGQLNILYLILGAYIASQGGMQNYTINDPFATESGVINWLKSIGLQFTNTLLNLGVGYDPITGTDLRKELGFSIWYAMGAAELASKYATEQDFLDDINNSEHFFVPFDRTLQIGLNTVLELNGGLYNWQRTILEWISDTSRCMAFPGTPSGIAQQSYFNYFNEYPPSVRSFNDQENSGTYYVGYRASDEAGTNFFRSYHNLFINTSTHTVYMCNDAGLSPYSGRSFYIRQGHYIYEGSNNSWDTYLGHFTFEYYNYTYSSTLTPYEVATYLFSQPDVSNIPVIFNYYCLSDWIENVYWGPSWEDRRILENNVDFNFGDIYTQYYLQTQNDYLLDIKGLLSDLINITTLLPVIKDNFYDTSGNIVIDPSLIQVSITLPDDNPLPVNLNDVSDIIDNTYLDLVKERATQASETIGEYVAFWHNCDPELVYVSLGAILVIAIGAFIGKWGHS